MQSFWREGHKLGLEPLINASGDTDPSHKTVLSVTTIHLSAWEEDASIDLHLHFQCLHSTLQMWVSDEHLWLEKSFRCQILNFRKEPFLCLTLEPNYCAIIHMNSSLILTHLGIPLMISVA